MFETSNQPVYRASMVTVTLPPFAAGALTEAAATFECLRVGSITSDDTLTLDGIGKTVAVDHDARSSWPSTKGSSQPATSRVASTWSPPKPPLPQLPPMCEVVLLRLVAGRVSSRTMRYV